ncbi:response regulator [Vitiosangium sp. GDMCC 1.1324]|uniref:hybrid sensor histidine kinase/response regulator n=1 Tax=Vitiosangium sp. (strain GDMCC 1.1324) TaxID=2138576 RepID=UPI000D3D17D3|nr:response regulator [Vitiosangium sp. GDMCC 1.1324]PTL84701.1 hybrid sensor histidine kinase/response regulator [Vitiosangium sp. GDMCC 1.1324]
MERLEADTHPIQVLLVEDDEDDFILTRDCLRSIGPRRVELEWVETCEQALEALESSRHDVCLLDYRLGATTGLELLHQAQQRGWRVPFILLTGQDDATIDHLAQQAGAVDFLEKSQLSPTVLGRSIRYALQHARTMEALRRSQDSFRELIERLPDGIGVQREDRLVYVNPALVHMLGCTSADELVGMSVMTLGEEFLQAEVWAALQAEISESIRTRMPIPSRELRIMRRTGGHVPVELTQAPLMFDGQPCMLWSVRDMTERRQMHARLLHSDRMASLGVLAAGVAHEINNPLAYTLSNLEFLETNVLARAELPDSTQGEVSGLLYEIRMGAIRVRDIVKQLKLFSRMDEDAPPEPVDVHQVLGTAIGMAMNELKHRARLVREYGEPLMARAHEGRLGQVILNLLVNAAHAIPEGDVERNEIRVVTRREGSDVIIEVRDTGVGIAEEHLERVFEPFFTTKPVGVGTGLGLSICHGIVTGFGGRMSVESRIGKGSTFRVILKAATAARPAEASRPQEEPTAARRGRILVVDDEPMIGVAIRRTLQREHEVLTLTSAKEAHARLLGGEHFDVILCDVMMPEMSGVELHQAIASCSPELAARMVFLTGGAFTPNARAFLAEVKNHRVDKPFSSDELRELMRTLLGSH